MKFFVDTADINEIRDLAATGLLDLGDADLERDPELLEDGAPLWRAGGEDEGLGGHRVDASLGSSRANGGKPECAPRATLATGHQPWSEGR